MDGARSLWLLLPRRVRELPADLTSILLLVGLTNIAVFFPVLRETPLRVPVGLVFVLFAPGYALIAALFPEQGEQPDAELNDDSEEGGLSLRRGIDGIERVALSFGLSIAVVPLIGLVLNFTPWGIRLAPIMVGVSGFTLAAVAVAAHRRWQLPPEDRFRVPYRGWVQDARTELFEPTDRIDGALNILLVVSILLAVGAVGYAVMVPPQGEQFTEFYLLTEDDEGELVASGYPTEFERGESQPVVVGIENHEGEPIEYTVVVQLQEVEVVGNETNVTQREELDRLTSPPVADNESWQQTHDIQPTMAGDELRLQYLLYRDDVPAMPTRENAYRDLHLWINVSA